MSVLVLWLLLMAPSILWGVFCAYLIRSKHVLIIAGLVPWLGLLCCLLFSVYVVPYEGVDATMWPIAQFFAGTIMFCTGMLSCHAVKKYFLK